MSGGELPVSRSTGKILYSVVKAAVEAINAAVPPERAWRYGPAGGRIVLTDGDGAARRGMDAIEHAAEVAGWEWGRGAK